MPAFADDAPATQAAPAAADEAVDPGVATAPEMMPMPDRAAMFAGDIGRLVATSSSPAAQEREIKLGDRVQSVLKRAMALLGTPYRWGGTTPDGGFDCSGLVGYVFQTALGIELPRVSRELARSGQPIKDRASLTQGDLVFFGRRGRVDHVGIYIGDGQFLHAPRTGKDVRVDSLASGYWSAKFLQARRVAL